MIMVPPGPPSVSIGQEPGVANQGLMTFVLLAMVGVNTRLAAFENAGHRHRFGTPKPPRDSFWPLIGFSKCKETRHIDKQAA